MGGHCPELFQAVDGLLDSVALLVPLLVEIGCVADSTAPQVLAEGPALSHPSLKIVNGRTIEMGTDNAAA
ncbi:hypothetical protein DEJ45_11740 [Streptomyces venezuelae]|nr:hypothetical protein DEJ45_11740 [Streptomyces venezuelae]